MTTIAVRRMHSSQVRSANRSEAWILVVLALSIFLIAVTLAKPEPEDLATAPIRVETGDTLWSLAREHPARGLNTAETVELIRDLNSADTANLIVGSEILVPAHKSGAQLAAK